MTLLTFPLSSDVSWAGHCDTRPTVRTIPALYPLSLSRRASAAAAAALSPRRSWGGRGSVQSEREGGEKVSCTRKLHLNFPWPHCPPCAAQR